MAKDDKAKETKPEDDEREEGVEGGAKEGAPKKGGIGGIIAMVLSLPKKLNPLAILKLPMKQKLMVGGGLVAVLLASGAGVFFLMSGSNPEVAANGEAGAEGEAPKPVSHLPPKAASFYDMPDIVVNIQTADGTPAYLKLTVALEIDGEEGKESSESGKDGAKAQIEPVLPRIVDQFQTYLRELRIEDIRGSVGVMRLKEELLRRVNLAAAPLTINDVLLKEMIVQ